MGGASYKGFPTKHPNVKNPDGSESNVLLSTFGFDDKQYVIPTMVEGKRLSDDEAFNTALQHGIGNYPSFRTVKQADDWARKYHGRVSPEGKIK